MNKIKEITLEIFDLDENKPSRSGGAHTVSLDSVRDRKNEKDRLADSESDIAGLIDHTILKPDTTPNEVIKICEEAEKYQFASVCVNPAYVKIVKNNTSLTKVCSVVGFPLGMNTTIIKKAETEKAIAEGADEIDMVINVGKLKSKDYNYVLNEITEIYKICSRHKAVLKVIIETCLLTEKEKIIAALLTKKGGADFVKTSTGFSSGGATVEDVSLLRKVVGPKVGVKASGGIRSREKAVEMIKAGANRIGASRSIQIIREK